MNNDGNLIKASLAAQQLGKKPITVRRMITDGRLTGLKNGSRWWVEQSSIEQFLQGGVTETDQNGQKSPAETEQSDTIKGDNTQEKAKLTAKIADYTALQGEIQQNATKFFNKCKLFPFTYLTMLYRYRDFEDPKLGVEEYTKTNFEEMNSSPMIDLLGDELIELIGSLFYYGFFIQTLNVDNDLCETYGIWRTDIHFRLELRDRPNTEPIAFSYPFCIADKDLLGIGKRPQIIDSKYWRGHGVRIQNIG
jgi:hypothetical protein